MSWICNGFLTKTGELLYTKASTCHYEKRRTTDVKCYFADNLMLFSFLLFRTHVVSSFFLLQHTTWKGKHICGADNIFSVCVCHHVTFQYCTEEDMLYVLHSTRESMEHYRNVLETSCGESCQNFSFRLLVQKTYFLTFWTFFVMH